MVNRSDTGYYGLCGEFVMKVLHLTLKKQWFDMILSGEKKEEYREHKEYWNRRLSGKEFDCILFRNGYSKDARTMLIELEALCFGLGHEEWGAPDGKCVWVLRLGKIKETGNLM